MIGYIVVLVPLALLVISIGLHRLITNIYGAIADAHEYLKERKELKWM